MEIIFTFIWLIAALGVGILIGYKWGYWWGRRQGEFETIMRILGRLK